MGAAILKRWLTLLIACFTAVATHAQTHVFLTAAEVDALARGRNWSFVHPENRGNVRWDLRADGQAFGTNDAFPADHIGSDNGTWVINAQGQLCLKWTVLWAPRCVAVLKEGEKFKLFLSDDLRTVFAEMLVR